MTAIKVENLSKAYQLGEIGTGTISRDLERWVARVRGKEDPFLKIGETNDRTTKGESDIVWSLKDLNFEINQGDAVGIIGRNGAGKSTLLKLLSRVTSPTTGSIKIKGRVASLLEVGTGFHPELTGRENIYLNGAILGMRKKEITRKFDEIVDFSGVERYIDTPVKRYSSGMYVRLAFAVAAHLDSEILIVDEVLAVGDAEFQQKCLGKMGDVSKGEGRTVLFVSHNMGAVRTLCNSGILLKQGLAECFSEIGPTIDKYLSNASGADRILQWEEGKKPSNEEITVNSIKVLDQNNAVDSILTTTTDLRIELSYQIHQEVKDLRVVVNLLSAEGIEIFSTSDYAFQSPDRIRRPGEYSSTCLIPGKLLNAGNYLVSIDFDVPKERAIHSGILVKFSIGELIYNQLGVTYASKPAGIIHPFLNWEVNKLA